MPNRVPIPRHQEEQQQQQCLSSLERGSCS